MFFACYPTATDKELNFYVKNSALLSIGIDSLLSELVSPVFQKVDNQIQEL